MDRKHNKGRFFLSRWNSVSNLITLYRNIDTLYDYMNDVSPHHLHGSAYKPQNTSLHNAVRSQPSLFALRMLLGTIRRRARCFTHSLTFVWLLTNSCWSSALRNITPSIQAAPRRTCWRPRLVSTRMESSRYHCLDSPACPTRPTSSTVSVENYKPLCTCWL